MRATPIYGAGDVRVEEVPDPVLREPTDALVRVVRSCTCGSDLWPYGSRAATPEGDRIGHEFLGVVEGLQTSCRHGGMWARGILMGRHKDRTVTLDEVPDGYRAMSDRGALKVLIQP